MSARPLDNRFHARVTDIIAKCALIVMFLALGVDMGGQVGLRNLLVPACAVVILLMKGARLGSASFSWLGLFVLYPSVSLIIGIEGGARADTAVSQYQSTVLSFILYLVIRQFDYRFSLEAAFLSIAGVAAIAIALFGLMYFGVDYFDEMLRGWHESSAGYFGLRLLAGEILPNIYFKSTLFFVPAFLYLLYRRYWLAALVCFLGLVAGISKTGIVACLLILFVYAIYGIALWKRLVALSLFVVGVLFVLASPIGGEILLLVRDGGETVDVRVGHAASLLGLFSQQPLGLLFGFGLGSEFYSLGVADYVTNIELDHINAIRKYGIVWFVGFSLFVLLMSTRACCAVEPRARLAGWALLVAFLVCGTNPVLISPVFFVLLSLVSAAVEQLDKERHAR